MSIQFLKDIINNKSIVYINDDSVKLVETKDNSKLNQINLQKIPSDIIILKSDVFQLNTIFGDKKNYVKKCDFLIITEDTIYFIELKSHERAPTVKFSEVKYQFKTVECIVDLIERVIDRFGISDFKLNKLNRKFFLFYHNPTLAKTRTSAKDLYLNYKYNSSDDFHSIAVNNGEEIYFDEIK